VQGDRIAAVLVTPDPALGARGGVYGYPYAGTEGWTRAGVDGRGVAADGTVVTDAAAGTAAGGATAGNTGMTVGTYDLPYDRTQVERLEPFDPAMLTD